MLSIHNYETNWFDLVRDGKIHIHIAEVESLDGSEVKLSDGQSLKAEALVCCTGWKAEPTFKIFSPHMASDDKEASEKEWTAAETELHRDVPCFRNLARRTPNAPTLEDDTPKKILAKGPQLYRFVIPWHPSVVHGRNLAYIGAHSSPHAAVVAQAQALWATAFLMGKVDHLKPFNVDLDSVRADSILHSTYGQTRRPKESGGAGAKYPDLVFDSIPYVDVLLADLGLQVRRKATWWDEMFGMYRPADYAGIVNEWMTKEKIVSRKAQLE
jgi:hypothetical protein